MTKGQRAKYIGRIRTTKKMEHETKQGIEDYLSGVSGLVRPLRHTWVIARVCQTPGGALEKPATTGTSPSEIVGGGVNGGFQGDTNSRAVEWPGPDEDGGQNRKKRK